MRKNNSMTYFLLLAMLLATVTTASAQSWLDYDQVLSRYPLLHTSNAAALTCYSPADTTQRLLGDARLTMSTAQGHLAPLNAAPHQWQAGADVKSIYRMSRRVVVRGLMDYCYQWGSQAGGSVWIDAAQMPFDITEASDTTRGNISLETYRLNGEVGVEVGRGWSLGARVDYTTASGAKKKDPRHTVSLMNCEVGAGFTWHAGGLTLGGNYLMRRTTQALKFSTVGRTDQIYHYLIDYGASFGRLESTDGNGRVGSANERPLLDMRHGLAIQAAYRHGGSHWGIEGGWMHRHGHYGLESPSMIDFDKHSGNEWHVMSWWQHEAGDTRQRITARWSHQQVNNRERTYRIVTTGGVTDVTYYEDRPTGDICHHELEATAVAQWGIVRHLAAWEAQASVSHDRRAVTASLFPFYRQQQALLTAVTLQGSRNWLTASDHTWGLTLVAAWAAGGGTASYDGTYQTPSTSATKPANNPLFLMRQYEYLTSSRLTVGAGTRWSAPVRQHTIRLYVEASYRYCQAFDIDYLQDGHRHQAALTLGCLF